MNLPVNEQNLHFLRKTYYICVLLPDTWGWQNSKQKLIPSYLHFHFQTHYCYLKKHLTPLFTILQFIQNLKCLLLHQFHCLHFAKWLPEKWVMDYGIMVLPFCPRSMVSVPSMISLFRHRHKMTHRAPNERRNYIYTGPIKMKIRLRLSTSPIDLDRSRLMLHWKDDTFPL
jgi:hypothetical protein